MYKSVPIILGLILLALTLCLPFLPISIVKNWISGINNIAYDQQLKIRLFKHATITSPIAIVDIDDQSIKSLGRWPWPRSLIGELISRIQQDGAAVIAVDFMLSEQEPNIANKVMQKLDQKKLLTLPLENTIKKIVPDFNEDNTLATILSQSDNVLGFSFLQMSEKNGQLPLPTLSLLTAKERNLNFLAAEGYLGTLPALQAAA
ncbi:MAG: CHASE2 domain-containing protein, partial [Gammaproteobacteria bacterium]